MDMKNEIKCYRCGKEFNFTFKTVNEEIKCSHCNGVMKLDSKSQTKLIMLKYVLLFVVALALSFTTRISEEHALLLMGISLVLLFVLVNPLNKLSLYLCHKLFKLNYVEYHPDEIEKAKRKAKIEKEKAKRLKAQKRAK